MTVLMVKSLQEGSFHRFISSDDVERLRQRARKLKRRHGIPHSEALELVAQRIGFDNWHKVVEANNALLPTERAVREGVVIAMDQSEPCSEEIKLPDGRGLFVSDALLSSFYEGFFSRLQLDESDEENEKPNSHGWTEAELKEFARHDLDEHVFYRFVGKALPPDSRSVFELVSNECFWGPRFIWIKGELCSI